MTELSEDIEVLTPGQILSEGRREAGLTCQDVADQLNLRIGVIEALEQDEIDTSISLTFTKGYLRAYARLLGLSEQEVLDSFDTMEKSQVQIAEMQSFSQRLQRDQQDNWLLGLTVVIVILISASLVIWWWQQRDVAQPAIEAQPVVQVMTPAPVANEAEGEIEEPVFIETPRHNYIQPQSVQSEVVESQPAEATIVDEPSAPVDTDTAIAPEEADVVAEDSPIDDNAQPVVAETSEPVDTDAVTTDTEADSPVVNDEPLNQLTSLVLTFSRDCWVQINDSTGERLAIGVKKKGRRMPVEGIPPFKIKMGAPGSVAIEYNGKAYPFEVEDPSRMLNLTVPE